MSGICGYRSLPRVGRFRSALLDKMLAAMAHRGPDSSATLFNGRMGLSHARLLASPGSALPPHRAPLTQQVRAQLAGVLQRWMPDKRNTTSNVEQMPLANWFREELRDWVQERLIDSHSPLANRVKSAGVRAILAEHNSGQCDHASRIYSLLAMDLWSRNHMA